MKRFALILLTLLLVAGYSSAGVSNLRLGPEGEILGWLVIGPFPNPGTENMTCMGFDTDCLFPSEAEARPVEGQTVASTNGIRTWKLALADTKSGLDFLPLFGDREPGVAYACTELASQSAKDVRLLLGSDDGVKVWVNGKLVHTNHQTRGTERDRDKVDIHLDKGPNRLLFKVDQHFGGWGLIARIANQDGSKVTSLVEKLDVQMSVKSDTAIVRRMAGKDGSLDIGALNEYRAVVHKAEIWMPWLERNPGKASSLKSAASQWAGKISAARGPDALSAVLAQAVIALNKQFDIEWAAFNKRIQNPEPLVTTDVAKEDYVRVAEGGRYFVHPNGAFFIPLGYNHNPDWPKTYECGVEKPNYNPAATDKFFAHLHDCGVNVLRLMVEAPLGDEFIEKPVGTFNPGQVAWIDNYVRLARKHDIKLMLTPWDTFWMSHRWDINPYNIKNGGPVDKRVDFITKRETIEAQKKRWKFIIDRWGNTGTIFAWELMNECDLWWEASPEQLTAWASEMGDYVRKYEKQKWGRSHLTTISIAKAMPEDGFADVAFRQPGVDIANNHLYIGAANAPDEPIGPALAIRLGVNRALSNITDNRPYIDTEDGPINRWIEDGQLDNAVFHNMIWAHLATGGAGSGMRWPYRNPHHLSEGMYQELKLMSKFAKDVPWDKLTGAKSPIKVTAPNGWIECSTGASRGALIWVTSAKPSAGTISITWPDAPKSVKYKCYDTKTGEWFAAGDATVKDDALALPLDGKHSSAAIVLE